MNDEEYKNPLFLEDELASILYFLSNYPQVKFEYKPVGTPDTYLIEKSLTDIDTNDFDLIIEDMGYLKKLRIPYNILNRLYANFDYPIHTLSQFNFSVN